MNILFLLVGGFKLMSQPIFDQKQGGFRVFIGSLGSRTNVADLQHECERYGPLVDCWVARNPPGFAFVLYKYGEDADSAVRNMDGRMICGQYIRVEHAKARSGNGRNAGRYGGYRGGDDDDDGNDRRRSRRRSSDRRSRSRSREHSKKKSSHRRRHENTHRRKHKSPSSDSDDSSTDRDKKNRRKKSKSPSTHSSRSKSQDKDEKESEHSNTNQT